MENTIALNSTLFRRAEKSALSWSWAIRFMDILLSAVLLVFALPLMAVVTAVIWICDGRPAFFRQLRYGAGLQEFTILKFRTMRVGAEKAERDKVALLNEPNVQTANDSRVTKVGAVLRKLSLDELPQLLQVFTGKMSLVGPRPIIRAEVEVLPAKYMDRFRVLPGITGLAQVSGRSELPIWDILNLDLQWVEMYSWKMYFRVLWETFSVVLRPRMAY